MSYRGRFAPSPTGPLHAGSILTALASYLDARSHQGVWLVRIEDLDPPRVQAGAELAILKALEAYGLEWDQPLVRQSERLDTYQYYLDQLLNNRLAYRCSCSRSELKARSALQQYDGYCRSHPPAPGVLTGIRCIAGKSLPYIDHVQGVQPAETVSDFIIFRRDGLFAYQLAVVVDDHLQEISHIVRGKDLLTETPKQQLLQQSLRFSQPIEYAHLPLILAKDGQKLSKQTFAEPVGLGQDQIRASLIDSLRRLKQNPPKDLIYNEIQDIIHWAVANWTISKAPKDLRLERNQQ